MAGWSNKALTAGALIVALIAGSANAEEVSRALAKPLKAAQDALVAKNLDEALRQLREAQATAGKTAYDQYVINELLGPVYAQRNQNAEAFEALSANAESQYLPAANKAARYKILAQLSYQLKNYPGVVDYGNRAIKAGEDKDDVLLMVAQANYLQNKCREAAATMQEIVNRAEKSGGRPREQSLLLMSDCYRKLNDTAAQGRVLEKLLGYYPKPDYWQNAMLSLQQDTKDERLQMALYRLMDDVGTLKRPDQFSEMAQLAVEQGFPGEAQRILEQAFSKNVYTEPRDKDRNIRLLENAKKLVATERATLAKAEKEAQSAPNGELLVAVGSSYLLNVGDPEKAATLIEQGIAKGSLKSPNNAYMMLGLAEARAKKSAEAQKAFGKVDGDEKYERLAKLWSLRIR